MKKLYIPRLIDKKVKEGLESLGGVSIEGPKGCGKSTTGKQFAKTVVSLQYPSTFRNYEVFASTGDDKLLAGEKPLMFDEWQKIPEIWDYVRADIDEQSDKGLYILTGSSKPTETYVNGRHNKRHTGIGRIAKIVMNPMSLWESGDSSGEISLNDLFNKKIDIKGTTKLPFKKIAFTICRGGWPETVTNSDKALTIVNYYYKSLIATDIIDVDGINRNPKRAEAILHAYARNISTFASFTTLIKDIEENDYSINRLTFTSYINAFEKLYVINDVGAWLPKLRSKSIIRSTPKRQFIDPSIAACALKASPQNLMNDTKTLGFLFESLGHRDLRIYADIIDGNISHYHDENDLEVDAIVHLRDGRWGAIEIKLTDANLDSAAQNLLKFKNKIDNDKLKDLSFLMILTGTEHAYKRSDGILVVPIGCLKD